jgi:hypothetical protein
VLAIAAARSITIEQRASNSLQRQRGNSSVLSKIIQSYTTVLRWNTVVGAKLCNISYTSSYMCPTSVLVCLLRVSVHSTDSGLTETAAVQVFSAAGAMLYEVFYIPRRANS